MPTISIIAVVGKNRAIGRDNHLLWDIPEDLVYFRKKTAGHPVIMGRKTYQSIGRPLPKRPNIIVTRDTNFQAKTCIIVHSLEDAIEKAKQLDNEEIFIIGGAQIYQQGIAYADKLYITEVDDEVKNADAFFPEYSAFSHVISKRKSQHNGLHYIFLELERS